GSGGAHGRVLRVHPSRRHGVPRRGAALPPPHPRRVGGAGGGRRILATALPFCSRPPVFVAIHATVRARHRGPGVAREPPRRTTDLPWVGGAGAGPEIGRAHV